MPSGTDLIIFIDSVLYNATGLLFVVFGVFLLVRVTGFPDMTVDGSFSLGAALYSVSMIGGAGLPASLVAAVAAGCMGGLLTWTINSHLGVGKVVAGVLSMITLILAAPYVSGGSTSSLLRVSSIYDRIDAVDRQFSARLLQTESYQGHLVFSSLWSIAFALFVLAVFRLLRSRRGLRLRYSGSASAPILVPPQERRWSVLIGLMAGNAVVALGGAIEAQRRGGFTANIGVGIILVGLAVLVLGESIFKSRLHRSYLSLREHSLSLVMGTVLYCIGVQLVLMLRIGVVDIRLLTAMFLLIMLAIAGRVHSRSAELF